MSVIVMTYLCLLVGFVVFFSIIQSQSRQKAQEVGLLKTIGASPSFVNRMNRIEILGLSFFAISIGAGLGIACSTIFLSTFFDSSFSINMLESPLFLLGYSFLIVFVVLISMNKLTNMKTIDLIKMQGDV